MRRGTALEMTEFSAARQNAPGAKQGGKPASGPTEETEEEVILRNPLPPLAQLASQAEAALEAAAQRNPQKLNGDGTSRDPFLIDYLMAPIRKWIAGAWGHDKALNGGTAETAGDGTLADAAALPETGAAPGWRAANAKTEPLSPEAQRRLENQKTAAQLEKEITQLIEGLPQQYRPNVTVTTVFEGILITLTDGTAFKMFKISSATPSRELVYFLERMGSIVDRYPGGIIIRGHTDARQYSGDIYGNWRLSANRATMTYYMLARGKLGDGRFLALEGFADREPKNKADPLAGENRRIEILIHVPNKA